MSDAALPKYSDAMKRIEAVVQTMQNCDDVDDAIAMYEEAAKLIQGCQRRLDLAQGKFDEIRGSVCGSP